jgi:hypothetical protein
MASTKYQSSSSVLILVALLAALGPECFTRTSAQKLEARWWDNGDGQRQKNVQSFVKSEIGSGNVIDRRLASDTHPPLQEATSTKFVEPAPGEDKMKTSTANFVSSVRVLDTSILVLRYTGLPQDKPVCRISGVCRMGDGSYLLPYWMKRYSGHIESCGIEHAKYSLHRARSELDGDVWAVRGFKPGAMNLTDTYFDYDLIGGNTPRGDSHWLVTDLTPSLFVLDLSFRFKIYQPKMSAHCIRSQQTTCPLTTSISGARPLLLVDVRVSEQENFLWPKGFIRMIRNGLLGSLQVADLQEVYGWRLRTQAACFRSLITTRAEVHEIPPTVFDSSHFLFDGNALSRDSVRISNLSRAAQTTCDIKVLILNKYGKRHMVGDDALRAAITAYAQEVKADRNRVRFLSEAMYFETIPFHEQVSVMQESSVVVSAHGPSNANAVFLRPASLFIEVVPFGLEPDTYASIAKTYSVQYRMVMAQPDMEVFGSCVHHFNPTNSEAFQAFIKQFAAHAERFKSDALRSDSNPSTGFRIPANATAELIKEVKNARHCANYQRLSFNVKDVAKLVVDEGLSQCGRSIGARS